ncbi:MAG: hypothetical protein BroJett040_23300 [Oligoflexia bacterium]|nr:MAG: hypothetical protein BroJett040_23300 [Oligoflexia bacterium]
MLQLKKLKSSVAGVVVILMMTACEKSDRSFSLLSDTAKFQQTTQFVPRKIDILWVVDNSGSMATSQQNLTDNFASFITRFESLSYDFHMAVTSTDAWRGKYIGQQSLRRVRDGSDASGHSNVFVMDNTTSNLSNVFMINATQGINGTGDERAFESLEDVLTYTPNNDFRRTGAYLAVIIVSDEDDFSATTSTYQNNNYSSPNLISVQHYQDFFNNLVGADNYSVNAITIMDAACRDLLNQTTSGRRIGVRYMDLADRTKGMKVSLCSAFGENLTLISDKILELANTFKLDREPIPETIKVTVNGVNVSQDAVNGWTYDSSNWTIAFHGTSVPPSGADVQIHFDPVAPKN